MIFCQKRMAANLVIYLGADTHKYDDRRPPEWVARRAAAPLPRKEGGVKFKVTWESPGRGSLARGSLALM